MCDNDVRGLSLIKELQSTQTSRDGNLEFSFRADGSVRATGVHMFRGRALSEISAKWGKSATARLLPVQHSTVVDFRDDVGWKAVASVEADGSAKLVAAVEACVKGDRVSVVELEHGGSTRVIRIRPTVDATIDTNALRNILVTPMVVDLLIYGTYADVLVARTSNLVGGLAHIGSTSGFAARNAGKRRQRRVAGASRSYDRLCRWATRTIGSVGSSAAGRGYNHPRTAAE